ncbi:MAG: hypothetical protein P8X98_15960 [Woeseiaceae bacterium]
MNHSATLERAARLEPQGAGACRSRRRPGLGRPPGRRWGCRTHAVALGLVLFGTIANWLATLLAGLWGTGAMMPIAAGGRAGAAWQEIVVTTMLFSLSLAMVAACVAFLAGCLRRRAGEGRRLESPAPR